MFTQHVDGYEVSTGLLFHCVDIGLNKQGYSYSPKDFLKFLQNCSERHFFFFIEQYNFGQFGKLKKLDLIFFFFIHCTLLDFFFFLTLIHASFWANSSQTDICHSILVLKCQPQTHKHCWNAMEKKSFKSQMG